MVKGVLQLMAGVLVPFKEKNDNLLNLKLICITVIAKLLILLVL